MLGSHLRTWRKRASGDCVQGLRADLKSPDRSRVPQVLPGGSGGGGRSLLFLEEAALGAPFCKPFFRPHSPWTHVFRLWPCLLTYFRNLSERDKACERPWHLWLCFQLLVQCPRCEHRSYPLTVGSDASS